MNEEQYQKMDELNLKEGLLLLFIIQIVLFGVMIGLIIPPADIKKFVQKTAQHVAINGSQFQNMLLKRQLNQAQFSFLKKQSPYRAYYDHRVAQISKKLLMQSQPKPIAQPKVQLKVQPIVEERQQVMQTIVQVEDQNINPQSSFRDNIFQELKQPSRAKFISEMPANLSQGQMAMIQHTARYAARNGKNFLVALSEREKNNPQFEFLKTSSESNKYFLGLVEGYTNLFSFTGKDLDQLGECINNRDNILNKCQVYYEYHRLKLEQGKGRKENNQNKKQNYIDWNDYQLVETVMFDQDLDIRSELTHKVQRNLQNTEEKVIFQPKRKQILQQCHACKISILASEMNKHLKSCIGNKKKVAETPIYQGVDIKKNFESLSGKRSDIFGESVNQIVRIEQNEQKIIWDGQAPNITKHSATIAMLNNQKKKRDAQN